MQFKLRTLFLVILGVAVICGIAVMIEQGWNKPARIGRVAQVKLDAAFAQHQWSGWGGTWHYDRRVRITSRDIGDDEIKLLYPILREIYWLDWIELYGTSLTDQGLADIKREFPNCQFSISDRSP